VKQCATGFQPVLRHVDFPLTINPPSKHTGIKPTKTTMHTTLKLTALAAMFTILSGCATLSQQDIPGDTLCDSVLREDVYLKIREAERAFRALPKDKRRIYGPGVDTREPIPTNTHIVKTRIVKRPDSGKKGKWTEAWKVSRFGQDVEYTVQLEPSQGGTYLELILPPVPVGKP